MPNKTAPEHVTPVSTAEPFHRSPERFHNGWLRLQVGNTLGMIGTVLVHAAERFSGESIPEVRLDNQVVVMPVDQQEAELDGQG